MYLSNAEIQKRFKEKLKKDGKWVEYLRTQRIHKQVIRHEQKMKEISADTKTRRKMEREQKKAYRRAKTEQASVNLSITCAGSEQQPSDEPSTSSCASTPTSSSAPAASQLIVKLPFSNPRSKALKRSKRNMPRDAYKEPNNLINGLSPGKKEDLHS